jgi:predicted Zn-dependent protease
MAVFDTMHSTYASSPVSLRAAAGRPVLTSDQLTTLAKRIMQKTTLTKAEVTVKHTARVVTRIANGYVITSDDGDELSITVSTAYGGLGSAHARTNQIDETALLAIVAHCDRVARDKVGYMESERPSQKKVQDSYVPVRLWHDATIAAMASTRDTVIPEVLERVAKERLVSAGFLGLMARAQAYLSHDGYFAFNDETDSELTVTARSSDGRGSGWDGQSARDWSRMQPDRVADRAISFAKRSANPVAVEPGRRTAILGPAAVLQMIRLLGSAFHALSTDNASTPFSRLPQGNKLGQRMFDPRISMHSDPADPDGGYCPYFQEGYGTPAMQWVDKGVLTNLSYEPGYAMARGKVYSALPWSIRLSGGTTTIDEMIARCAEGIYVNRLFGTRLVDPMTGLTTGVTRDGCFLVKDGKISKSVKNFRFLESPFFFLNKIEALGVPERATYGYTPRDYDSNYDSDQNDWPRRPIIVPPMMVRDFNFTALADAV